MAEKAPEISPKRMGFKEISSVFVNGFKETSYRCVLNCFQRGTPLIHGSGNIYLRSFLKNRPNVVNLPYKDMGLISFTEVRLFGGIKNGIWQNGP